jgi:hypothetical protein
VSIKRGAKSRADRWEQTITVVITLAASVVAIAAGAPDKWLTAIFCTVVTFSGMISYFKRSWRSKRFWAIIGGAFLMHSLLAWVVFGIVLRQRDDVGLLVCLPGILLECFVLYHAVRFCGSDMAV